MIHNSRGFSVIEVLMGATVFTLGMLGIAAMHIRSINENSFAANMTEATTLATNQMEVLMGYDYDTSAKPDDDLGDKDGDAASGLDDADCGPTGTCTNKADHMASGLGKNNIFSLYWNIAQDVPITNCKTIKIIAKWSVKENQRSINIQGIKRNGN